MKTLRQTKANEKMMIKNLPAGVKNDIMVEMYRAVEEGVLTENTPVNVFENLNNGFDVLVYMGGDWGTSLHIFN